ncbi:MAG TPA: hypothetical protein VFQ88_03030 [Nevskiaceae bacterium]|nr:hypothetical protein [Nevskiaceae bacterium]
MYDREEDKSGIGWHDPIKAAGSAPEGGPLAAMLQFEQRIADAVLLRAWGDLTHPSTTRSIRLDAVHCVRRGGLDRWLRTCSASSSGAFERNKMTFLVAADQAEAMVEGRRKQGQHAGLFA